MKSVLLIAILLFGAIPGRATTQGRTQRPQKNRPQYPNIIAPDEKTNAPKAESREDAIAPAVTTPEFVKALEALTSELKQLVQEVRAMNVREQAQLDMLRLARVDGLLINYERELKTVREQLDRIEREDQALTEQLKPENLAAQVGRLGTIDRDATTRLMKRDLEARQLAVQTEKARVQARETELSQIVDSLRSTNLDTERRLLLVEDALRQLSSPRPPLEEKKP